jgi:hypothetical protein
MFVNTQGVSDGMNHQFVINYYLTATLFISRSITTDGGLAELNCRQLSRVL